MLWNRKQIVFFMVSSTILTAGVLVLTGCTKTPEKPVAEPGTGPVAPKSSLISLDPSILQQGKVTLEQVRRTPFPEVVQVMGRIGVDDNRTARVGAIADGRIVKVVANQGDSVKQGDRLAFLRSHQVDVARSEYAKAQAELKRRQAGLEFARNASQRAERLYQLKAGSVEEVQRAKAELENAEAALTAAKADIGRIAEELGHLGLSPESAMEEYGAPREKKAGEFEEDELVPVVSPISGSVLRRLVSPGTVVTPSNDLFVLSDLGSLWLTAEVPEKHLAYLKIGRMVNFTVQAYPQETFTARIIQIGDTLDPDTRTVQLRCQIDNTQQKLKPEMYATTRFELGETRGALAIPDSAVQDVNGQNTVFVRVDEKHFRPSSVRLGRQAGSLVEVLDGLKPGETIAKEGSFLLKSEMLKQTMTEE